MTWLLFVDWALGLVLVSAGIWPCLHGPLGHMLVILTRFSVFLCLLPSGMVYCKWLRYQFLSQNFQGVKISCAYILWYNGFQLGWRRMASYTDLKPVVDWISCHFFSRFLVSMWYLSDTFGTHFTKYTIYKIYKKTSLYKTKTTYITRCSVSRPRWFSSPTKFQNLGLKDQELTNSHQLGSSQYRLSQHQRLLGWILRAMEN